MPGEMDSAHHFTKEMIDSAVRLWTRSSVSLIDVRYCLLHPDKPISNYSMPTSMLIYTCGESASVRLDHTVYQSERFGLFHGGKGTELAIHPSAPNLEAFMVLYKAEQPFYKRELVRLAERINPFAQVYGFSPKNPLFFTEKLKSMYDCWSRQSAMDQLYAKTALYQLVYEIYKELERADIRYMEPDYVEWVKQYLQQHYAEPVSIQLLAEMLPISRSLLSKLFKKREHRSLQEYLNETRLDAAKRHLQNTNATIQEVAAGCGFVDELNLIRMFKKYFQMTPSDYRRKMIAGITKNDIDNYSQRLYNDGGLARLAQSTENGEITMFGQTRSKEMIATAALALMLLLSACGSTAPANNAGPASSPPAQTQAQETANTETKGTETVAQTRVVKTIKGDVEVPADPQRVVVNWYAGDVFALDLNIVGFYCWAQETMPFYDRMMESTKIESWEQEEVMALDPDLIITYSEEDYDKFSSIAPVLVIPEINSIERVQLLAEATGREEVAKEAVERFEAKLAEAKSKFNGDAFNGKTFSIVEDWGPSGEWSGIGYETGSRGGTLIYDYLGLNKSEKLLQLIEETGKGRGTISYEVAHEYFGDYILWFNKEGSDSEYKKTPIWNSIPAVKNNNIVEIPGEYQGLFYYSDVLSLTAQLDYIVDAINAVAH